MGVAAHDLPEEKADRALQFCGRRAYWKGIPKSSRDSRVVKLQLPSDNVDYPMRIIN